MAAWTTLLLSGLGTAIPKVLEKLGEKAVVDPALEKGFEPFRNWFTRRYDEAKANRELHAALMAALDDLRAELHADPHERLFATLKFTGLDAQTWETLAAAAIEMTRPDAAILPAGLPSTLNLPPGKSDLLARFLFLLRKHLAGKEGFGEGIRYADQLEQRGLLHGIAQQTAQISENTRAAADWLERLGRHFGVADDEEAALREYMQTLGEQLRYLPLPLADPGTAAAAQSDAELRRIFVPLSLRDLRAEEEARRQGRAPEARGEKEVRPIGLGELLARHPAFALIGKAGCGKTTLLKMAALAFLDGRYKQDLHWRGEPLFPIFVRLRNFGAFLAENSQYNEPGPGALTAYLTHHFSKSYDLDLTPKFFTRRLKQGQCLVLLDGLDEVSSQRANVARQVNAFIRHYQARGNHFGLASRPRGYESVDEYLRPASLAVCDVNPLDANGIRHLIANLLAWIVNDRHQQAEDRKKLTAKILASPSLTELASTPLFCTALTLVYKYHGSELPQRRVDVLEQVVDLLLGFWTAQKPGLAKGHELAILDGTDLSEHDLDMAVANKRSRLSYLAYQMQIAEQKTEVDGETARRWLQDYIEEHEGQPPETAAKWAQGFLRYAHEHSGLFVEQEGPGVFVFTHEGFREYLAARELIDQGEQAFIEAVLEHLVDDRWEQVLLLAAAYRGYSRRARRDLIDKAIQRVNTLRTAGDETWVRALTMTGAMARDMDKYLPAPKREAVKTTLHAVATDPDIKPVYRASAADALDALGYLHPDLYRFVRVDGGQPSAVSRPSPAIYIAQFPVTNAQYKRFLEAPDFTDPDLWRGFPQFDEHGQPMDDDWGDAGLKWLENLPSYRFRDGIVYPRYWHDPHFGIARPSAPVVDVSWYGANAYCKWLARHWDELEESRANPDLRSSVPAPPSPVPGPPSLIIRLPTEAEWLAAAGRPPSPSGRGAGGEGYPWDPPVIASEAKQSPLSDEERSDEERLAEVLRRANVDESGIGRTTPVWTYPLGRSPRGVWDLGGNVWEWQANYYGSDHVVLALRGGSWEGYHRDARLAARDSIDPDFFSYLIGFRVMVFPSPQ